MTAPTTAPRTWTTTEILAEATDDIDVVETDTALAEDLPAIIALTAAVMDIDPDGLDHSCVRAERFTH
jgi:hypothetical protein